jgi:hypothetical protein
MSDLTKQLEALAAEHERIAASIRLTLKALQNGQSPSVAAPKPPSTTVHTWTRNHPRSFRNVTLEVLRRSPEPLTIDALKAALAAEAIETSMVNPLRQLTTLLHGLQAKGRVRRHEDGTWSLG